MRQVRPPAASTSLTAEQTPSRHPLAWEFCDNGVDDNGNAQIDEGCPAPLTVDVSARCALTLRALPPDATAGWAVQFYRETFTKIGAVDSVKPYSRSITLPLGTHVLWARWSKAGQADRESRRTTWVCQ